MIQSNRVIAEGKDRAPFDLPFNLDEAAPSMLPVSERKLPKKMKAVGTTSSVVVKSCSSFSITCARNTQSRN